MKVDRCPSLTLRVSSLLKSSKSRASSAQTGRIRFISVPIPGHLARQLPLKPQTSNLTPHTRLSLRDSLEYCVRAKLTDVFGVDGDGAHARPGNLQPQKAGRVG